MSSILTNTSAMVALQTLQGINKGLATTQGEISTGLKVATAKDNAATWAIASVMRSDVSAFKAIQENLALGSSTVNVARNASETVTDLLSQIKEKIVQAQEDNVDRAKIQEDVDALRNQIQSVVSAAQFNGLNLVNATAAGTIDVLSSLDRDGTGVAASSITVDLQQLGVFTDAGVALADGEGIEGLGSDGTTTVVLGAIDVTTSDATRDDALAAIEGMIQQSIDAAASFGSVQKRIEIQGEFIGTLVDSLKTGIGSLVDTDMEEASARLQALQVQQQLGVQALSIANRAPQTILSLFQ